MLKKLIPVFIISFLIPGLLYAKNVAQQPAEEADQQISEFSLAGYAEEGKKNWDISGKTADIFTNIIKLNAVVGNLYGEKENIKLTADRGDFDKVEGRVHLEQNVVITTSSGAKLETESLDWDRKKERVSTREKVRIEKENMVTTAIGAVGEPNLNKITFTRNVQVNIRPVSEKGQDAAEKEPIVITCDGPLKINYEKNIATFQDNVKVDRQDLKIFSDLMDVYFSREPKEVAQAKEAPMLMGSKMKRVLAHGNVKIMRQDNTSYSDEAVYDATDKKITLTGRPKLVIYSAEELDASSRN